MSARQHIRWAAILLLGCLIALLSYSQTLSGRLDLTADQEFTLADSTLDLLGELDDRLQVKLYFNRDIEGAEGLLPARMVLEDLLDEMAQASNGKMVVETVDPTTDLAASRDAEHIGIAAVPLPSRRVGSVSMNTLYQGLEMRYHDASEVIPFAIPAEFEFAFVTRLQALLKPDRSRVAFFSRESPAAPPVPGIEMPIPADRIFANFRAILYDRYRVEEVLLDADSGGLRLGEDADLLVVARPENVNESELASIQNYLGGGGHVLILWDTEEISPGLGARPIQTGLKDWLAS
ncbi:MAG: GldG family protein, partial [Planctomycetes bacterium]|nr:GldG family protein [Planctomycetota bacterium]